MNLSSYLTTLNIGITGSLILLAIYLIKKGKSAKYISSANIILSANGIVGGFRVGYIGIVNGIECDFGQIEQLYIFLGGVAVVWASWTSLNKLFQEN